mmetsp:Transcript_7600/g.9939  ORF Transcript_7600/g.9939 Transcript_7600/m.9939 type:complete len:262 (-) Transcript_7600:392-1177(-)
MDANDEQKLISSIAWWMVFLSIPTFITIYAIPSTWGKTLSDDSVCWWHGPRLPARLSWLIFESPNLVWAIYCWYHRKQELSFANYVLFSFFLVHYIQRDVYYPFVMSDKTKPMPLAIVLSAFLYTSFNGYIQCRSLLYFHQFPQGWDSSLQFYAGLGLAILGFFINLRSDATLRSLRSMGLGYQIAMGGLFTHVSSPHYFGEILEWTGFAIACQCSLVSVAFAIYTAANLIPRGMAQHAWYHIYFGNKYPRTRKAVIPFLV